MVLRDCFIENKGRNQPPHLVPVGLMDACDSADFWEHATTTIPSREAFVLLFAILLETVSLDPSQKKCEKNACVLTQGRPCSNPERHTMTFHHSPALSNSDPEILPARPSRHLSRENGDSSQFCCNKPKMMSPDWQVFVAGLRAHTRKCNTPDVTAFHDLQDIYSRVACSNRKSSEFDKQELHRILLGNIHVREYETLLPCGTVPCP